MKITIIGTGYVGLVSGACFAETGVTVTCVDIDKNKIEGLRNGVIPIYEPGLEELVKKNIKNGRLFFTTKLDESINKCDAVFIAVGTPSDEDGKADLQYVLSVAEDIGDVLSDYIVIVNKSTVPIGTAEKVRSVIRNKLSNRGLEFKFDIASNPEFLKEGDAIRDFLKPDRVVIGVDNDKSREIMLRLYHPFVLNNHPVITMDIPSAEMTKYAANSMLATKISFINDIANLCELVGANVDNVRKGIGSDSRIGDKFIYSGCGYGGSCFPKDVKALINTGIENDYDLQILKSVENVNYLQKCVLYKKINKHFNNNIRNKKIAIWGVSFKPNTDDMREATSIVLINELLDAGADVVVYDPIAMDECEKIFSDQIMYANNQYEALTDADCLVIVTEWSEFKLPKFTYVEKELKTKVIFDGRNIYDLDVMARFGYTYYSIGRPDVVNH